MENIIRGICFLVFLIGTGAIWFVLPTLIAFPFLFRLRKGVWRFPCNLVDVLTILSVCIIWVYFSRIAHLFRNSLCINPDYLMLYDICITLLLPIIVAIPPIILTELELRKRFG